VVEHDTPRLEVFSVQMHVHGSFSEGRGSIDWHTEQARALGVDVIWWSDHDWRIGSHKHPSQFGFDSTVEPIQQNESWVPRVRGKKEEGTKGFIPNEKGPHVRGASAVLNNQCAASGASGLHMSAASDSDTFERYTYRFSASRGRHIRPLAAGITLRLAVRPREVSSDARPLIEVELSEHSHGSDAKPLLRYYLDNSGRPAIRSGEIFEVPVPFSPARWNRLVLPITKDVIRGFPEHHGEDNAARVISVGVEARRGRTGAACFDELEIRQETYGQQTFQRQAELLRRQAGDTPSVIQLQGAEISFYWGHLNELSVGTQLLDYETIVTAVGLDAAGYVKNETLLKQVVNETAVDRAHSKRGLVSCNHALGTLFRSGEPKESRSAKLARIVQHRCWGADLLEVGYRARGGFGLNDHLWLWDELSNRQLFMVGTGVSDSHGSTNGSWAADPNNFVTWVYSRSATKTDLIEGLQHGRAFFGDITLFDGTVDLRATNGTRMGDIVITEAVKDEIQVEIDGVQAGDRVHLVQSGQVIEEARVNARKYTRRHEINIPGPGTCIRVEVYSHEPVAKAFSNPICYVRNSPVHSSRSTRARLKVQHERGL
jgi:hypothetical protein